MIRILSTGISLCVLLSIVVGCGNHPEYVKLPKKAGDQVYGDGWKDVKYISEPTQFEFYRPGFKKKNMVIYKNGVNGTSIPGGLLAGAALGGGIALGVWLNEGNLFTPKIGIIPGVALTTGIIVRDMVEDPKRVRPITYIPLRAIPEVDSLQHNIGYAQVRFKRPDEPTELMYGKLKNGFVTKGEPVGGDIASDLSQGDLIWRGNEFMSQQGWRSGEGSLYSASEDVQVHVLFHDYVKNVFTVGSTKKNTTFGYNLKAKAEVTLVFSGGFDTLRRNYSFTSDYFLYKIPTQYAIGDILDHITISLMEDPEVLERLKNEDDGTGQQALLQALIQENAQDQDNDDNPGRHVIALELEKGLTNGVPLTKDGRMAVKMSSLDLNLDSTVMLDGRTVRIRPEILIPRLNTAIIHLDTTFSEVVLISTQPYEDLALEEVIVTGFNPATDVLERIPALVSATREHDGRYFHQLDIEVGYNRNAAVFAKSGEFLGFIGRRMRGRSVDGIAFCPQVCIYPVEVSEER